MEHQSSLIALLCIGFVMAFALGLIAQRLKLSPLVGYLVAGVIAGPYASDMVGDATLAPQIAEVGIMLLMFGVGLHFSLRDLGRVWKVAVPGALGRIAVMTAAGWAFGRWLEWSYGAGLMFGLALSVASTVVLMRVLEDHQLEDSRVGQATIGWVVVEDIAMVLALVLLPPLLGKGGHASPLAVGALTLAKMGAFVAVMLVVGRRVIPRILEYVAGLGSRELFTLCVLAVAMGVAYGASTLFGVSFALGAFFAGVVLNESEFSHKAAEDSLPMRDAFSVLFFFSVGLLFDPQVLLDKWPNVLATVALIVGLKAAVGWVLLRLLGERPRDAVLGSVALAQIGEFSFILIGLGATLGVMGSDVRDLVLAGALLSIIANPILFALVRRWLRPAADLSDTDDADATPHVILVGYGRVGRELAPLLKERGVPVTLVESDGDRVIQARGEGLTAVMGNAVLPPVLAAVRPGQASLAILAIPRALEAGQIIHQLRRINPQLTVLARAHSEAGSKHLLEHGADATVLAERELAHALADMVMATPPYRALRTQAPPPAPAAVP